MFFSYQWNLASVCTQALALALALGRRRGQRPSQAVQNRSATTLRIGASTGQLRYSAIHIPRAQKHWGNRGRSVSLAWAVRDGMGWLL